MNSEQTEIYQKSPVAEFIQELTTGTLDINKVCLFIRDALHDAEFMKRFPDFDSINPTDIEDAAFSASLMWAKTSEHWKDFPRGY